MNKSLEKIVTDSRSGSTDLLIKLARLYKSNLNNIPRLEMLIGESEKQFTTFAVIESYIKNIKTALKKGNVEALKEAVMKPLNQKNMYEQMFIGSQDYLAGVNKVFSFSNSMTVAEILFILKEHQKNKLKVYITESRPAFEGRVLVERILVRGIKTEFGTDAQFGEFIRKCDAVFCGADRVLKDGSVINKTGSLSAAIIAAHYQKPFYVFAESGKISHSSRIEEKKSSEVWEHSDKNLKIRNNYFEKVPSGLISLIFTEKGIFEKK